MNLSNIMPLDAKITLKPSSVGVEIKNKSETDTVTDPKDEAKLKKSCKDFEAVFLNFMLEKMRESVPKSDLMGKDNGEAIYQGMLDEQLSKQMSERGGMGISDLMYKQLIGTVQTHPKAATGSGTPEKAAAEALSIKTPGISLEVTVKKFELKSNTAGIALKPTEIEPTLKPGATGISLKSAR